MGDGEGAHGGVAVQVLRGRHHDDVRVSVEGIVEIAGHPCRSDRRSRSAAFRIGVDDGDDLLPAGVQCAGV